MKITKNKEYGRMERVLLKLSGEALAGDKKTGFDEATCLGVAKQVKKLWGKYLRLHPYITEDIRYIDTVHHCCKHPNLICLHTVNRLAGSSAPEITRGLCLER